jgi:hypothetical protein
VLETLSYKRRVIFVLPRSKRRNLIPYNENIFKSKLYLFGTSGHSHSVFLPYKWKTTKERGDNPLHLRGPKVAQVSDIVNLEV